MTRRGVDSLIRRAAEVTEKDATERVAATFGSGETLTYKAWLTGALRRAKGLRGQLAKGDRVIIDASSGADRRYLETWLAVILAGGVAVPVGTRFSTEDRQYIQDLTQPALVLDGTLPQVEPFATERADADGREVVDVEGQVTACLEDVGADDLYSIIFTSGTTGRPRGTACPYGSVTAACLWPESTTTITAFAPDSISFQAMMVACLGGNAMAYLSSFTPAAFYSMLDRTSAEYAILVPSMAHLLTRRTTQARPTHLKELCLTGAPAPVPLLERLSLRFPQTRIVNDYSLTEAGGFCLTHEYGSERPGSLGRPSEGVEVEVRRDGEIVGPGIEGEIFVRGRRDATRRFYYGEPTSDVFAPDGAIRTGDWGYVDEEGYLFITDRVKDLISVGGIDISSASVENAALRVPGIVDAAACGVDDPLFGESVGLSVVTDDGYQGKAHLADMLSAVLPEVAMPRRLLVLDELPKTQTGKIVKRELKAMLVRDGVTM